MIMVGIVVNALTIWSPSKRIPASARPRKLSPGRGETLDAWGIARKVAHALWHLGHREENDLYTMVAYPTLGLRGMSLPLLVWLSVACSRPMISVLGVGGLPQE